MPTPAKPTATDWREIASVDIDEAARAAEGLVAAGVDGILSLGTLGECATLTPEEKRAFLGAVVETVRGRVPVFAGTTSLGTRETIAQTREAYDIGASGTMLGLPMWCPADLRGAVTFYRDVAEACPDGAICVYANTGAFRFGFDTEFWKQVSQIRQVVSAKIGSPRTLAEDIAASGRRIRFLPTDRDFASSAKAHPDFITGFWSSGAPCGPSLAVRLRDEVAKAVATGNWAAAEELGNAVGQSLMALLPKTGMEDFARFNIALEKARIDAAGWMKAGPCRPPYQCAPEELLVGARQSGEIWAALAREREVVQ